MITFTIEEARALLPVLKEILAAANNDLQNFWRRLKAANDVYEQAECALERVTTGSGSESELIALRLSRGKFQDAIDELSDAQSKYLERLNYWVVQVTEMGVVLRDLREGLLDFPARQGELEYYLCWRTGEPDISHWHLAGDGYIGRKPLAALPEYF